MPTQDNDRKLLNDDDKPGCFGENDEDERWTRDEVGAIESDETLEACSLEELLFDLPLVPACPPADAMDGFDDFILALEGPTEPLPRQHRARKPGQRPKQRQVALEVAFDPAVCPEFKSGTPRRGPDVTLRARPTAETSPRSSPPPTPAATSCSAT